MQSNYLIWGRQIIDGACTLSAMTGYAQDWKLLFGKPVQNEFPLAAKFLMDPGNPTGIALTDSLYNLDRQIVASARLRAVIEDIKVASLEYLPVAVINHKHRPIVEPYVIIHPVEPVDCLVLDACDPEWNLIDSDSIESLQHLVIDENRVDPSRLIFRPKAYSEVILTHRSLAAKIDAAGCTGIRWIELSDWPES